jgi:hypothetical protein
MNDDFFLFGSMSWEYLFELSSNKGCNGVEAMFLRANKN